MRVRWPLAVLLALVPAVALASPNAALAAALTDASRLPAETAYTTRYLTLYNVPANYRRDAKKALDFQANSLSTNPLIVPLRQVTPDLLALDLRAYDPDLKTWPVVWERFAKLDPYFHAREYYAGGWDGGHYYKPGYYFVPAPWLDPVKAKKLEVLTDSAAPLLRADWWMVLVSRQIGLDDKDHKVGYYDWLGIKDRRTFEQLLEFDEKKSIRVGKDKQAALKRSGVNQHGRKIDIFASYGGFGYYRTLDAKSAVKDQNPVDNPERKAFRHDAEEHYGVLPNGLFVYLLCDQNGKRQDSAPDFIGPDNSPLNDTGDPRIHIGLACIRCHTDGLRPIDDWFRRVVRKPLGLGDYDKRRLDELTRQYFSDLGKQLRLDRAVFADAVDGVNGLTVAKNSEVYSRFYSWYVVRDRDPDAIAAEIGYVDGPTLVRILKDYASHPQYKPLPNTVSGLIQTPPDPLRVEELEEHFATIAEIVRGFRP